MKPVRFHPEAELEMVEQARYYETKQEGLGKRFLESVQASCRQIQLFPHIFSLSTVFIGVVALKHSLLAWSFGKNLMTSKSLP